MAKRDEVLIAKDRAMVCDLLRKGYRSKTEIASIINENREKDSHISVGQVTSDIEFMKNEYISRGMEDINSYRNQIEDELIHLQRTYWTAYELSRRSKITLESDVVTDQDEYAELRDEGFGIQANEDIFARQVRAREETRAEGNPAMLQGVLACIDRRAKIHGVDAPNKIALTDPSGNKEAINVFDVMKRKLDEVESRRNELEAFTEQDESQKLLHD